MPHFQIYTLVYTPDDEVIVRVIPMGTFKAKTGNVALKQFAKRKEYRKVLSCLTAPNEMTIPYHGVYWAREVEK